MQDSSSFDHIVIGAGIEGSSTAYSLVQRGKKTLLIDQFPLENNQGSSQGCSRIIRRAYAENYYACMMNEAYEEWDKIENAVRESLLVKTGLVVISQPPYDTLDRVISTFEELNFPHQVLDNEALKTRFPSINYGADYRGVFDPDAGILRADRCLAAIQKLFAAAGGKIREADKVENIIPGNSVVVKTATGSFRASSVVICAGPWATQLLPKIGLNLPLHAKYVGVFYWPEKISGLYSAENFPDFIDTSEDVEIYGLPALEYPGEMKLCCSYGEEFDPSLTKPFNYDAAINILRPYIKEHFPNLDCIPSRRSHCFYTETPDKAFVLDRHPQHKNIVIGAGFSGTGFKMGPVVGKILGNLATNVESRYDLSPFSLKRFEHLSKI